MRYKMTLKILDIITDTNDRNMIILTCWKERHHVKYFDTKVKVSDIHERILTGVMAGGRTVKSEECGTNVCIYN